MSWRKVAYLDEVATLSDTVPQILVEGGAGTAGIGTAASRDDHVHPMPSDYTPKTHATSHKDGGGDAIKINELADPTGAIEINKQSLVNPVIDPQATAPATPVDGQVYYNTADDHLYCYVA